MDARENIEVQEEAAHLLPAQINNLES